MKKLVYIIGIISFSTTSLFAQEEESTEKTNDTTRINLKKMEILIVEPRAAIEDTVNFEPKDERNNEAHWAGIDFGFTALLNSAGQNSFLAEPFLKNDIARSHVWNFNILEHKFKIIKEYVGLTTGLGFSLNQVSFDNNYVLGSMGDSTFAVMDTVINYEKNKLRATYLTVPLLLEFNTNKNNDKGVYLAAGVVGGLRIASRYKQVFKMDGDKVRAVQKSDYNLNPFKLDATARLGYGDFGAFVSYSMLPLFEQGATVQEAYPLTAGLTLNF